MGRVRSKRRSMKIKARQKRREKLAKLRKFDMEVKSITDKQRIFTKAIKLVPWLTKEEFEVMIS